MTRRSIADSHEGREIRHLVLIHKCSNFGVQFFIRRYHLFPPLAVGGRYLLLLPQTPHHPENSARVNRDSVVSESSLKCLLEESDCDGIHFDEGARSGHFAAFMRGVLLVNLSGTLLLLRHRLRGKR